MPFAFRDMARSIEFYLVIRSPRESRTWIMHRVRPRAALTRCD
jgi:hypothetical protein